MSTSDGAYAATASGAVSRRGLGDWQLGCLALAVGVDMDTQWMDDAIEAALMILAFLVLFPLTIPIAIYKHWRSG
jgi:hypothetical protein